MRQIVVVAVLLVTSIGLTTAAQAGLPPVSVPPYNEDCPLVRLPASCIPQWVQTGPDTPEVNPSAPVEVKPVFTG